MRAPRVPATCKPFSPNIKPQLGHWAQSRHGCRKRGCHICKLPTLLRVLCCAQQHRRGFSLLELTDCPHSYDACVMFSCTAAAECCNSKQYSKLSLLRGFFSSTSLRAPTPFLDHHPSAAALLLLLHSRYHAVQSVNASQSQRVAEQLQRSHMTSPP